MREELVNILEEEGYVLVPNSDKTEYGWSFEKNDGFDYWIVLQKSTPTISIYPLLEAMGKIDQTYTKFEFIEDEINLKEFRNFLRKQMKLYKQYLLNKKKDMIEIKKKSIEEDFE